MKHEKSKTEHNVFFSTKLIKCSVTGNIKDLLLTVVHEAVKRDRLQIGIAT